VTVKKLWGPKPLSDHLQFFCNFLFNSLPNSPWEPGRLVVLDESPLWLQTEKVQVYFFARS
jgi:hypothetical protein